MPFLVLRAPSSADQAPSADADSDDRSDLSSVKPGRSTQLQDLNVLAQVKKTYISASQNALGIPISFTSHGDLSGQNGFLFKIESNGNYQEINPKTGANLGERDLS